MEKIGIPASKFTDLVMKLAKFYNEAWNDGVNSVKGTGISAPNKFVEEHLLQIPDLYPISIDDIGIVYKSGQLNGFGGLDVPYQQVLKSAAGYYIGTLYFANEEFGSAWLPNSRDSEKYYNDRESAELEFKSGKYPSKITP